MSGLLSSATVSVGATQLRYGSNIFNVCIHEALFYRVAKLWNQLLNKTVQLSQTVSALRTRKNFSTQIKTKPGTIKHSEIFCFIALHCMLKMGHGRLNLTKRSHKCECRKKLF